MEDMARIGGLVGAAAAGRFAIDRASGQEMILSIGRMRSQLNDVLRKLGGVATQNTPLGTLPEAEHVAMVNRLVASGDQQSATYALAKFAEALEQAETAVRQGMANYYEVEAEAERSFDRHEAESHRRGGMRAV